MKNFNISIKTAVLLPSFLSLVFVGIESSLALEENTGSMKTPLCKARSTREPGRLNIDTSAKVYGLTQPCESFLSFYIAKNTALRSLDGKVGVLDSEKNMLFEHDIHINLQKGDTGMYHGDYSVGPIQGYNCRNLILKLSSLICQDKKGERIDCPKIRLKSSMILKDLLIDNQNLNVCFND